MVKMTAVLKTSRQQSGCMCLRIQPGITISPTLGTGQVRTVISSGLFLPAAMAFAPDGAIYVPNVGFGLPPNGLGQILKITLP